VITVNGSGARCIEDKSLRTVRACQAQGPSITVNSVLMQNRKKLRGNLSSRNRFSSADEWRGLDFMQFPRSTRGGLAIGYLREGVRRHSRFESFLRGRSEGAKSRSLFLVLFWGPRRSGSASPTEKSLGGTLGKGRARKGDVATVIKGSRLEPGSSSGKVRRRPERGKPLS